MREADVLRTIREECGKRWIPFPQKATASHLRQAKTFLAWCEKKGIDPGRYLTYWFQAGDKMGRRSINLLRLRSNALAEAFVEFGEGYVCEDERYRKLREEAGSKQQQQVKALRILTVGHEALKARYYGRNPELCLAEIELSGGFHPESRYCVHCPVAVRCAAKLYQVHGFDVVALRSGRLRDLPPDVAAAAVS